MSNPLEFLKRRYLASVAGHDFDVEVHIQRNRHRFTRKSRKKAGNIRKARDLMTAIPDLAVLSNSTALSFRGLAKRWQPGIDPAESSDGDVRVECQASPRSGALTPGYFG